MIKLGQETPWGAAQRVERICDGVYQVSTASHGGIYVSDERINEVDDAWRVYASKWSHGFGDQWFEEDCAVCGVFEAFPKHFTKEHSDTAKKMREMYIEGAVA